jgi:hypothetical protein
MNFNFMMLNNTLQDSKGWQHLCNIKCLLQDSQGLHRTLMHAMTSRQRSRQHTNGSRAGLGNIRHR